MANAYFPSDPYQGVVTFDGPELHLAALQVHDLAFADMSGLMDETFPAIFDVIAEAGAQPCGPPLALHSRMPTDTMDFALGVPITEPFAVTAALPSGRAVTGVNAPAGPIAATSYLGPYEGLGEAWGRFLSEVSAAGHSPSTRFFECYVSNPMEITDPSTIRTDLVVFLEGS